MEIPKTVREEVQSYLDERRLLATRLEIASPEYVTVAVEARIRVKAGSNSQLVVTDVAKRLYRYINPVYGGTGGDGWPFGRSLSSSEIYATIQAVADVDYIEEVQLFPVDAATGERQAAATKIDIPANSLIYSHKHEVIVEG